MKIIDRIYLYIEYQKITISDFEKKNALSNGYLGKMKGRNASVGEDVIVKILENCPELSIEWLILGKGDMILSNTKEFFTKNPIKSTKYELECELREHISDLKDRIEEQKKIIDILSGQLRGIK